MCWLINLKIKIYSHWWNKGRSNFCEFCFVGKRKLPVVVTIFFSSTRQWASEHWGTIDKVVHFLGNKCKYMGIFLHWSVITCQKKIIMCKGKTVLNYRDLSSPAGCLCCLNRHKGKGWSVNWTVHFVHRDLQAALCTKHCPILYLVTARDTLQKPQGVQGQWNHYSILYFALFTAISVNWKKCKFELWHFEHNTNENFKVNK